MSHPCGRRLAPLLLLAIAFLPLAAADAPACEAGAACPASMEYRFLGNTGLKVSALSYGAWISFGLQLDVEQAYELMKRAYLGGVNFFDNAETYAYGKAETIMGEAIKMGLSENLWARSDLVVSTKIYWAGKEVRGPNDVGLSRKHIVEGLSASLQRLQLDYVDVVFCHRPDNHTPMEEIVRAMNHVLDRGWAFYWGTSEWSAYELAEAYAVAGRLGLQGPVVEQPQYSMLHRERFEVEYAPLYKQHGLGTTVWSALASGVLTGKYNEGIPDGTRLTVDSYQWLRVALESGQRHGDYKSVLAKVKALEPVAKELGCTQAQLALAWALKNPNVSTVILGATKVSQIDENLQALSFVPKLTSDVMARIEEILDNTPSQPRDWRSK